MHPVSRVGHEVAHSPSVFEINIIDASDVAVTCHDGASMKTLYASQRAFFTGSFGLAEMSSEQTEQPDDDQVDGNDVIQQARHHENQNAGNQ